jgi:hypothetical protein
MRATSHWLRFLAEQRRAPPRGTDGSNPSPSSGESAANSIFEISVLLMADTYTPPFCRSAPPNRFTNTSTEYWRGDASLIHTNVEGTKDIAPSASVRIYHFAGTQHSSGTLPLTDTNPVDGARGQQKFNSVDYTPLLRAALVRMDRWVTEQEAPPSSRYPRLADGTAVPPEQPKRVFTALPAVGFPAHLPQVRRLDFGSAAECGIATTLPPVVGKPHPHFVPVVDQDGNEASGVRLPDLTVPLATYTGWNLRHPQIGAPDQLMSLMGSTIPFPATRRDREVLGDPRLSISERYPSKTDYLAQVRREAQRLVEDGHLLADDLELVVDQASRRSEILLEHKRESLTVSNQRELRVSGRAGQFSVESAAGASARRLMSSPIVR